MNIIKFLSSKGIDTIDSAFYKKIEEWNSWYISNVRNFSSYRVYSGKGTYTKRRRKSLGMAKKVCEDIADLLLNEKVKITLSDEKTAGYVNQVLCDNNFKTKGNECQERKAATGTVAYVPYLYDMEVDQDGVVLSGKIKINYVSAKDIYPVSWDNGTVHEVIFALRKTVKRKKYVNFQHHHIENGQYVIENMIVEADRLSEGHELTEQEWRRLKPFRNMAAKMETGSLEPQFVIDKLNKVNNTDEDESNPMGVALFADSIDILKSLDIKYDSYCNEFELGKKRIFVAPEMIKNVDGSPAFDPDDSVFYQLPDDYDKEGTGLIKEVDMDLRTEAHSKAINDDLNYLSMKCGFGTERYRFEKGQVKTATEVISVNSDMFRSLKKHENVLDDAIKELVRIIIRLGIVLGEPLNMDSETTIDFDDSIIEDKSAERESDRKDVAMGAMKLEEYRSKWYGETEEEAKENIQEPAGVIE